jgi:hypothetical protein
MSTTEVNNNLLVEELSKAFAEDFVEDLLDSVNDHINERLTELLDELVVQNNLDNEDETLLEDLQYEAASKLVQALTLRLQETWK